MPGVKTASFMIAVSFPADERLPLPVTVLADLRFSSAAVDDGLRALAEMLADTRAFDGCVSVDVVQEQDDPTHVILIEVWEAAGDHRAYMTWRASSGTNTGLRDALAQPPALTYLDQRHDV